MRLVYWSMWLCAGAAWMYGYQGPPPAQTAQPQAAQPQAATTASLEGQVFHGSTGAPLKKATVRLVLIGRPVNGGMPQVFGKETDEQGRFAFTGLAAGRYNLSAQRQGFLQQNYGGRKYSTGGTPIPVAADQHLKNLNLKLSPQSVITGKVLDEDGDPVANLQVRAFQFGYRGGKKQWYQVGNGQTSDIGEYRIPNLDPGRYQVATVARMPNNGMLSPSNEPLPDAADMVYASTYYPSSLDAPNGVSVDVTVGAETRGIDIRLRKTRVFRVRGRVMNATGGRGNIVVMLSSKDGTQTFNNNSPARPPENRFEIRGVSPGSYVLHAQIRDGNQQAVAFQELQVGTQHIDNVMLTVAGGNDIPGGVKVEDTTTAVPMPNLTVNLRPSLPIGINSRAKVDEGQKFVLQNVPPLHYSVRVSGVPDTCFVKSIRYAGQEVPEDGLDLLGAGPIEVVLSATAGQVDAAVVDKEGKPVPSAMVSLAPKGGPMTEAHTNTTDEKGAVTFKGLQPGEYRLIAWEDVPWGAIQDPEFVKPYEGRGEIVKLDPSGHQAVQLKVIPAEETDK